MEILEAYDLTGSYRDAGELAGCSHHTVAGYVQAREEGRLSPGRAQRRPMLIDAFLPKLEEWVDRSKGKVRADVAHGKLVALGYTGSERTTRRAVAEARVAWRAGQRRVHRPWVPEPGMWFQYDFGTGPRIGGVATWLFCAWLAWCRFRVVLPTDNEKTVTVEHVAGIAVRNPQMLDFARHYGLRIATCMPADPASKGGSESTVKLAKADLVPTEANLLGEYESFAELEKACAGFCEQVNAREHRVTRRAPAEMLTEERTRLHPLPEHPYTAAFGVTRIVGDTTPMVAFDNGSYSAPHTLAGQTVWVRAHGDQVVIVHAGADGPVEVARHARTSPGSPRVDDAHFPPPPEGPLSRTPRPKTAAEAQFLALGQGAALWLVEAAAAGCSRMRTKMTEAVQLSRLHDPATVDQALGQAATAGRFGHGDLAAILTHQATDTAGADRTPQRAGERNSLAQGTAGWAGLGEQGVN